MKQMTIKKILPVLAAHTVSYSKNASFRKNVDDCGRFWKTTDKI